MLRSSSTPEEPTVGVRTARAQTQSSRPNECSARKRSTIAKGNVDSPQKKAPGA